MGVVTEIITAEHLSWKLSESGVLVEVASEEYDYVIDTKDVLWVYELDGDTLVAQRNCSDLDHAKAIAGAFEIVGIRNTRRGCDWWGRPWPNRAAK